MKKTNKLYYIILLLGIVLNIGIIFLIHKNNKTKALKSYEAKIPQKLERLHSLFSFTQIFEKKYNQLFQLIQGKTVKEMETILDDWLKKNNWPKEAVKIVAFHEHSPLNQPLNKFNDWQYVMDFLDKGEYQQEKTQISTKNKITNIFKAGVGFETLECRPGLHKHIGVTDENTYCIWFKSNKTHEKNLITHAIILTHKKHIKNNKVAKVLFNELKINKEEYGYLNIYNHNEQTLPDRVSGQKIRDTLSLKNLSSGFDKLSFKEGNIYVSYKPNGDTFFALEKKTFIPLPFFALSLFYLWIPVWAKFYIERSNDFKLSLSSLLAFLFILVILLPSILIYHHFNRFLNSKYESIRLNKIKQMENALIQIDTNSQEIYKLYKHEFKELSSIISKNPDNLEKFLIKSIELELGGYFDSCILMDKEGKLYRKHASVSSFMRSLPLYPDFFKKSIIKQTLKAGWVPLDNELNYLLTHDQNTFNIDAFLSLNPEQGERAATSLVKIISKELINQHNEKLGIYIPPSASDQVSSTIMSSLAGDGTEDPVATIQNSLGDFFDFGYAKDKSRNFVMLILNEDKIAEKCLILFSGIYNFNRGFLKRVFNDELKWPKGIKYLAFTPKSLCLNFPYLNLYENLDRITNLMQPPVNMYTEETTINGVPHLLCAYAAQKTEHYIYAAYTPLSLLDEKLEVFKQKLYLSIILTLLSLGFVLFRLFRSIIYPTKTIMVGISAIASHKNAYKIALNTGDEWEHLADTLNTSLESMKELEVATFIQDTILPTKEIVSGKIRFTGKTISLDGVGGDYYDAYIHKDNEMLFTIGDVSGHSVSAALVVSMAHAGFSYFYEMGISCPQEILQSFNALMLTNLQRVKMMTCFVGYITEEGMLISSNAGQSFPIVVDEEGNVEYIKNIGYPLGSSKRAKYALAKTKLPTKCRIILYSDGVAEALNENNEAFGYNRLESFIKNYACQGTSADFYKDFFNHLMEFTGPIPLNDDCTFAIVEYNIS